MHAFLNGRLRFREIADVIEQTLETVPAGRIHAFQTLYAADARRARERRGDAGRRSGRRARMSWFLAFAGFALLIVLHEAGHFVAAKAVGMRVERFMLFFGTPLVRSGAARPSTGSARSRSAAT